MGDDRTLGRQIGASRHATRRNFLAVGCASVALAAGCLDSGPASDDASEADPEPADDEEGADDAADSDAENGSDDAPTDAEGADGQDDEDAPDEDEADEAASLEHASATNMEHSPVLGPSPDEAPATIIMFDDPSCPACAYFEEEIFPDLEAHVDAGELSIAWRGIPVIDDWSDAALQILWATYERDVDVFWSLREHLFERQDGIGSGDEAIEQAVAHLRNETDLDAGAVRAEAEEGTYETRLERDEDAAVRAGLDATPYFYLFRDGEFRSEIRGAEDYQVFKSALEL